MGRPLTRVPDKDVIDTGVGLTRDVGKLSIQAIDANGGLTAIGRFFKWTAGRCRTKVRASLGRSRLGINLYELRELPATLRLAIASADTKAT